VSTSVQSALRLAAQSSVTVSALRRVSADSRVCGAARAVAGWCSRTRSRLEAGLAQERAGGRASCSQERLEAVAADSRVMQALSRIILAPLSDRSELRALRLLDPWRRLDAPARFRACAWTTLIAVSTHAVWFVWLGQPVHVLGWSFRASLALACALVVWRPEPLAAAWRAKTE
jgi:hypothetical protein